MRFLPLRRFGGRRLTKEEQEFLNTFPRRTSHPDPEHLIANSAEGEAASWEKQETPEEYPEEQAMMEDAGRDNLLSVFTLVDDEFVDNSALMNDVDDVPAAELLLELRELAAALDVRPESIADDPEWDA